MSNDISWQEIGRKLYQELRFVLVEMGGIQRILVSTSHTLDPLALIRVYGCRLRLECMYRELKQQTGVFCYQITDASAAFF